MTDTAALESIVACTIPEDKTNVNVAVAVHTRLDDKLAGMSVEIEQHYTVKLHVHTSTGCRSELHTAVFA